MAADKVKENRNFKELEKSNTEFISQVWAKVEDLEQIEREKKVIEKNNRIILKEKIKNISILLTSFFLSFLLMRFNILDDEIIVYGTAFLLLTWGNIIHNKENENKVEGKKAIKMKKWGYIYGN